MALFGAEFENRDINTIIHRTWTDYLKINSRKISKIAKMIVHEFFGMIIKNLSSNRPNRSVLYLQKYYILLYTIYN